MVEPPSQGVGPDRFGAVIVKPVAVMEIPALNNKSQHKCTGSDDASFSRLPRSALPPPNPLHNDFNPSSLGFPAYVGQFAAAELLVFPRFAVSGLTTIGGGTPNKLVPTTHIGRTC